MADYFVACTTGVNRSLYVAKWMLERIRKAGRKETVEYGGVDVTASVRATKEQLENAGKILTMEEDNNIAIVRNFGIVNKLFQCLDIDDVYVDGKFDEYRFGVLLDRLDLSSVGRIIAARMRAKQEIREKWDLDRVLEFKDPLQY